MTAEELIGSLSRRDVRLSAVGDRLRVDAPAGTVTPTDRAAIARYKQDLLRLLRSGQLGRGTFRYADGSMEFGDICAGWTPAGWAAELRRKADRCDQYRPDIAAYYRAWAADVEGRLPTQPASPFVAEIG